MTRELTGRVALVTGAGRGIGAGIARLLVAEGALVAVNDIDTAAAGRTVAELTAAGHQCVAVPGDVSEPGTARAVVDETVARLGGLGILVNNAATGRRLKIRQWTPEQWHQVLATNLSGPFFLAQAAVDHLAESGHGAIVNVCSTAVIGFFGQIGYDASKGGLLTLTRSLAVELGREGVRSNAVCPGFIDTGQVDAANLATVAHKQVATQPIARMGLPTDVAGAVTYLVSDQAAYITGQSLFVDGGWIRH
ncbi:SDR family NAD(P)-dependent oxidoreductase [Actinocrispum wychmicini]|uniref:3-oxoacyl-[acyl-carrier protein] reductase n=1 Tax=Actinocrispum wychmicini TaxID=1213861 RepID=A0A4R2K6Y3_9PSEU|nr:glucose 1-dehydrogenase [Actinocrispum wychmicini]TCO62105.1 3-oxoacyl-[acyl-carrier protein] reductase [Actinocrispum wychmicini]